MLRLSGAPTRPFLKGRPFLHPTFPRDKLKSGAPTLKRFCPQGKQRRICTPGSAPCPCRARQRHSTRRRRPAPAIEPAAVCTRARRKRNAPQPSLPPARGADRRHPGAKGTVRRHRRSKGDPVMNAREKRALFRKDFGQHLLPQGFTFREKRLSPRPMRMRSSPCASTSHPQGTAMSSMARWPPAMASAGPSMASPASPCPRAAAGRTSVRPPRSCERWRNAAPALPRKTCARGGNWTTSAPTMRNCTASSPTCFPRLVRVADARGALDFHEWETAFYSAAPAPLTFECVAVGSYDRALFHARCMLERWAQSERNVREDMERTGKASQRLENAATRRAGKTPRGDAALAGSRG